MSHKEMFLEHIVRPIFVAPFQGFFDYLGVKIGLIATGFPAFLAFDLFQTPEMWWKGLLWIVIMDWIGGAITAWKRGEFDIRQFSRKWYQATGYFFVCGASALMSNALTHGLEAASFWHGIFYNFQFAVYMTFFAKEFVSILQTWGLIKAFKVGWKMVQQRTLNIDDLQDLSDEGGSS